MQPEPMLLDRVTDGVHEAIRARATSVDTIYRDFIPDQRTTETPIVVVASPTESGQPEGNNSRRVFAQIVVSIAVKVIEAEKLGPTVADVWRALFPSPFDRPPELRWVDALEVVQQRRLPREDDDDLLTHTLTLQVEFRHVWNDPDQAPGGALLMGTVFDTAQRVHVETALPHRQSKAPGPVLTAERSDHTDPSASAWSSMRPVLAASSCAWRSDAGCTELRSPGPKPAPARSVSSNSLRPRRGSTRSGTCARR